MRAYCPVSFALKLAGLSLVAGLMAGLWLSSSDAEPPEVPATQVAEVHTGR